MDFAYLAGHPLAMTPHGGNLMIEVPLNIAASGSTHPLVLVRANGLPASVRRDVRFP